MDAITKRVAIIAVLVTTIVLGIISMTYQTNVVMPLKMAERGYCWQHVLVSAVPGQNGSYYSAYVPCSIPTPK